MALGLLATKPGTALGGRSRSQLPANSVPSNMKSDITPTANNRTIASRKQKKPVTAAVADNIDAAKTEMPDRERSMLSQVDLYHGRSDVSSIPDYDIFSHTETEVKRSHEQKKKYLAETEKQQKNSGVNSPNEEFFAGIEAEDGNKKKKGTIASTGFGSRGAVDPIEAFAAATSAKSQHKRNDSSASREVFSNAKTAPPEIKFSSEAANNYYKAMSVSKGSFSSSNAGGATAVSTSNSKKMTLQEGTASFTSDAGNNYYNAKVKSVFEDGTAVNSKASSKKSLKSKLGFKSKKKEKEAQAKEKKQLDQLVAEAMAVCQTPQEIAAYLLAKQKKGDNFPSDAMEGSFTPAKKSQVETKAKGATITQTAAASRLAPPAASPGPLPPVRSFEHTDAMSTTSSITHNSGLLKANKSMKSTADECSVTTELVPPTSPASTDILPRGPSHMNSPPHDIDPPLEAYPSPLCSPDVDELGYPDEDGKASVAKELVGLPDVLKLPADDNEENDYNKSVISSKSTKSVSFQQPETSMPAVIKSPKSPVEPSVELDLESYSVFLLPNDGDGDDDDDAAEALSTTGSASIVALSRGKSNSKKSKEGGINNGNKIRSVRSMSPMIMLKKKPSAAAEENKKETNRNKLPPIPPPSTTRTTTSSPKFKSSGKNKLRTVRSMSPSLFKKTPEIPEWDPAAEQSVANDSKSKVSKDSSNPVSDTSTAASSTTPTGSSGESKIIALAPEDPAAAEERKDEQPTKSKPSIRSASPIAMAKQLIRPIASSSKDTPVTAELKETISSPMGETSNDHTSNDAASIPEESNKKSGKTQNKKNQAALPPRIPSREVVPPPQSVEQQIITSSDDDGSVECSVMSASAGSDDGEKSGNDGMLQLTVDGHIIPASGADRESNNASPVVTTELDSGSVEVSVQETPTGSGSFANKETPKSTNVSDTQFCEKETPHVSNVGTATATIPAEAEDEAEEDYAPTTTEQEETKKKKSKKKKTKKSKLDMAKEKYQKKATHQQSKSPGARGVAGVPSLDPSADVGDDGSKATDSKTRKKDKLRKVMEYRSKASPLPKKNVDRETMEEWLVSKKSQDSSKGGHSNMLDKYEEELNQTEGQKRVEPSVLSRTSEKSTIDKIVNDERKVRTTEDEIPSHPENKAVMGNPGKPPLAPVVSTDSTDPAAPVRHINFNPKNLDDESNADVSLPPELKSAKKLRIWTEDAPSLRAADTQDVDNGWLCADGNHRRYDRTDIDDSTFVEGETETSRDATPRERRRGSIYACGVDPAQLKDDLVFEFKDYARGLERKAKRSVRNLFGTCDITQDGGVEAVSTNLETANDQLFGRKPMSYTVQSPRARQRAEKASNPQTEMMSSLLNVTEKETGPRVMSAPGVKPTVGPEEKKRLYLEKLKAVSLQHI